MDLNSVKLFVHVVKAGSFSAASEKTSVPVATVSRRVSELEKSLNVRLLERSTRHIHLTEAGEILFQYAERGLDEIAAGQLALNNRQREIIGTLRISLPPGFVPFQKTILGFQKKHPGVAVEQYIATRKIDLVEDGIDVALRVGDVIQQSIIARNLTNYRHILVASPMFFENNPAPTDPQQLFSLRCACWNTASDNNSWALGNKTYEINPYLKVNDLHHLKYLALAGECITELPPFAAIEEMNSGHLVQILKDFPMPKQDIQLIYPSRKNLSTITQKFVEYTIEASSHWTWPI